MIDEIVFAGSGHGGIVAFKSLQNKFTSIKVVTDDGEIIALFRKTDKLIPSIEESSVSTVVCAGYHSIISKKILKDKLIINTHPSLLPKYRGLHGLVWAMLNFEEELGFTIHLMNRYIDDGDILAQYKVQYAGETSKEIMDKFDKYVEENLGEVVKKFLNKEILPQKNYKDKATWVPKRNLEDCIVDFGWRKIFIEAFFKALVRPYPLPLLKIKNELYEIDGYEFIQVDYYTHLGRVVNIEEEKVYIKTEEGLLIVSRLIHYDTKKIYKANEILKLGMRL
jgi:methionyl-tRNA formyltransferase